MLMYCGFEKLIKCMHRVYLYLGLQFFGSCFKKRRLASFNIRFMGVWQPNGWVTFSTFWPVLGLLYLMMTLRKRRSKRHCFVDAWWISKRGPLLRYKREPTCWRKWNTQSFLNGWEMRWLEQYKRKSWQVWQGETIRRKGHACKGTFTSTTTWPQTNGMIYVHLVPASNPRWGPLGNVSNFWVWWTLLNQLASWLTLCFSFPFAKGTRTRLTRKNTLLH